MKTFLAAVALLLAIPVSAWAGYEQYIHASSAFAYTGNCTASGSHPTTGLTVPKCQDSAGSFQLIAPLMSGAAAAPTITRVDHFENDTSEASGNVCWDADYTVITADSDLTTLAWTQSDSTTTTNVSTCTTGAGIVQCQSSASSGAIPLDHNTAAACTGGACTDSWMLIRISRIPSGGGCAATASTADKTYTGVHLTVP